MVKKIIHTGDLHIRNLRRYEEYQTQLKKFIDQCKEITSNYEKDEVRIVITGDLFHNKLDISSEAYTLLSWFLRELNSICKTIIIAGNHDMNMGNLSRLDPLTAVIGMNKFDNVFYFDKDLGYESGCVLDDNIVWCLYSTFDSFRKPDINSAKIENGDKCKYIGLFHGDIKGSKTDVGYTSENGFDTSYFDELDFCLCGHIHKRQELTYNGIKIVYCGSLIQQDHGENINGHGYLVWDVENESYDSIDIENPVYSFYTFEIGSDEDIENNKEVLINN